MRDYLDDLSERLDALTPPNERFREVVESLKRAAAMRTGAREALEWAMHALEQGNIEEFKEKIEEAFAHQEAVATHSKEAENILRGMLD